MFLTKRSIVSVVLSVIMIIGTLLPSTAFAVDGSSSIKEENILDGTIPSNTSITSNTTIKDGSSIESAIMITGSSDPENPLQITIDGTVTCQKSATLLVMSGYVKITSGKETENSTLLFKRGAVAAFNGTLVIENITFLADDEFELSTTLIAAPNLVLTGNTEIKNFIFPSNTTTSLITVQSNGSIQIDDNVTITNNTVPTIISGGSSGSYSVKNNGGCITDNNIFGNASISLLSSTSSLTMTGGKISGNTSSSGNAKASAIYANGADLNLTGGSISAPDSRDLPAICFGSSDEPSAGLFSEGSATVDGKIRFEKNPEKDYYFISEEDGLYLSEYPSDTKNLHKISIAEISGGSVSTSPVNYAPAGVEVEVTPEAEDASFKLYGVSYTGTGGTTLIETGEDSSYRFTMPDEDVTVSAVFGQGDPHSVTIDHSDNGTVTVVGAGDAGFPPEAVVTLKVTPEAGYTLTELTASYLEDDSSEPVTLEPELQENGTYTFSMPNANVTVTAVFEKLPIHKILLPEETDKGTIASEPVESTYYTGQVTLTAKPAEGYYLTGVTVTDADGKGVEVSPSDTAGAYTFEMPDSDVTVAAEWTKIASGGTGTEEEPYEIREKSDLEGFRDTVNSGINFKGVYFKLTSDIDLEGDGRTTNWTPIGKYIATPAAVYPFSGVFDGDGHTIRNICIQEPNTTYNGLFGIVSEATVRNVKLTGVVTSNANAGMIAYAHDSVIENCVNGAQIGNNSSVGGIVGKITGTCSVSGCINSGSIQSGKGSIGGIIGSIVDVDKTNSVLLHLNTDTSKTSVTVSGCANSGEISHTNPGGGIIGNISGDKGDDVEVIITDCANSGKVGVSSGSGGIVGALAKSKATITDCYNTGDITAQYTSGGTGAVSGGIIAQIAASGSANISGCYSIGTVSSAYDAGHAGASWTYSTGQIAGSGGAAVTDCYSITKSAEVEGVTNYDDGTVVEEEDLKAMSGAAASLGNSFQIDSGNINDGYPILKWQGDTEYYTVRIIAEGDAASGVTASVNGTAIPESGIRLPSGGVATIDLKLTGYSQYTIGAASINNIDYALMDSSGGKRLQIVLNEEMLSDGEDILIVVSTRLLKDGEISIGGDTKPSTVPSSQVWDGETVDLTWFDPKTYEDTRTYEISTPAQLMGLAALVNGLVNEDCTLYLWEGHGLATVGSSSNEVSAATWNASKYVHESEGNMSGGQGLNESTDTYHYGEFDFKDKTIVLTRDIDMGASYDESSSTWDGPNYMPIGGQYLMEDEDTTTKLSASFNGTFDGGGHYVFNIYCDRHCSKNFGDGQSVGLIGRLGCHDSDSADMRADNPSVVDVAVTGYIYANRSVGGIVGKIGKTNDEALISGCANYATVIGTDAKGTGGIVGAGWNGSSIEDCFNMGSVTGGWPAGGISGSNESDITNCYNAGRVSSASGNSYGMAIATNNGGGQVSNTYYLKDSSSSGEGYYSLGSSEDREGVCEVRTAQEMTDSSFAGLLGGAFVADSGKDNQGYPIFSWQKGSSVSNPDSPSVAPVEEEKPEQQTTVVEADVKVSGESATADISDDSVSAAVESAKEDKSDVIRIEASADKDVSSTKVTVSEKSVDAIADAGTALEIETSNGSVTIPNSGLKNVDSGLTVTVTENEDGSSSLEILDGSDAADLGSQLVFTVNTDSTGSTGAAEQGSVLYLVGEDGTRELLPYSIVNRSDAVCLLNGTSATVVVGNNAKTFDDVSGDAWYADSVSFAASHEMFDGVGGGRFDPQGTMTRAMILQVLMNIEGGEASAASSFSDVPAGAWYAEAVSWGSGLGLVNGYGNGAFGPTDSITREQLAMIMYNYVQKMGYPVSTEISGDLTRFSDSDQVSSWASEALGWAAGVGLVNGNADGTLNPKGTATRAEVATIMNNFTKILLGV